MQFWPVVKVFVAAADGFSNGDRMKAFPMRLCMLTAAGHREQLLIGLQCGAAPSLACLLNTCRHIKLLCLVPY